MPSAHSFGYFMQGVITHLIEGKGNWSSEFLMSSIEWEPRGVVMMDTLFKCFNDDVSIADTAEKINKYLCTSSTKPML